MFDHAIGLWHSWFGQAIFDAACGPGAIKRMDTRGVSLTGGHREIRPAGAVQTAVQARA